MGGDAARGGAGGGFGGSLGGDPGEAAAGWPDASAIVDVLAAGVIAFRARDGVVTYANPGAAKILRRSLPELLGRAIGTVIESADALLAVSRRAAPADSRGELMVTLADGRTVAIGFSLGVLPNAECGDHYVLLFQEITSLLELRKQRDRLLQIAVIGEVMPTLLHEIRNPLAAVTAMLELLVEDAEPALADDLHAILSEVRRMALGLQGIGGLVRTMHSASHCAVDSAVRETCRLLEPVASRRGVKLRVGGPDLPLLPFDRGAICGVVFNLVKNAVDACGEGATVDVRLEVVDSDLVLAIVDDGSGMSPEVVAQCRDLFFTTKDTGSGVGLALCNQVAEASGGALTVESRLGHGTKVELRVPIRRGRASSV